MEWLVCESEPRWAPALRVACIRNRDSTRRLCEVRRLAEIEPQLLLRPAALLAIQVGHVNFTEVLNWLPGIRERLPNMPIVGLLDFSWVHSESLDGMTSTQIWSVEMALHEAGFDHVSTSPRRLREVIELGSRWAAVVAKQQASEKANKSSLADLWTSLPWQPTGH
jgi:hypothetical protein